MALILLRHTTPQVAPGTCYGRLDLPLAETFQDEAERVVAALPEIESIVSSPLTRCRQLADYIAEARGLTISIDPRLIEIDFGTWEGKPWTDIPREGLDQWADDFMHARPHGGECVSTLTTRVKTCIGELSKTDRTRLIVTHAGVIKAALATTLSAEAYQTQIEFGGTVTLPMSRAERV